MQANSLEENTMPDQEELTERVHALEVAQSTQTAVQAGAQATQAAVQAGAQATQAAVQAGAATTNVAAHAGTLAAVAAGGVCLVVGIFLGIAIRGASK